MNDARVKAIREHLRVGSGSCTSIDECWEDAELVAALNGEKIETPDEAVKWALEQEELFLEQGLNARWGADDDEQLLAWRRWHDNKENAT